MSKCKWHKNKPIFEIRNQEKTYEIYRCGCVNGFDDDVYIVNRIDSEMSVLEAKVKVLKAKLEFREV